MTREQEIEQALRNLVAQHYVANRDFQQARAGIQVVWGMTPSKVTSSRTDLILDAERALLRPAH